MRQAGGKQAVRKSDLHILDNKLILCI